MQNSAAEANLYPDWFNSTLCSALQTQWGFPDDHFIFGAGATEIIHLVADALLGPGDELVWANPSYGQLAADAQERGATVVEVPLTADYRHDLPAMAAAISANTTVVMITNPNNPTGTLFDPDDFHAFMLEVPLDVLVVMDQAYYDYISESNYPDFREYITNHRRFLIIRTFSKVYGLAGARAGYGVSTAGVINELAPFKLMASLGGATESGAVASLQASVHYEDTISLNTEAKEFLYSEFTRMGLTYIPSEANFVQVDVERNGEAIQAALAEQGILVRTGWDMPTWLRVSTGTMPDMMTFVSALEDILFGIPPMVRDLTVQRQGSSARLQWSVPGEVDWYQIYRNRQAAFNATPADSVGATTDTNWVDPGVINNSDHYFYRVRSHRNGR
jgi:histidinol-phosphate aminotransferase